MDQLNTPDNTQAEDGKWRQKRILFTKKVHAFEAKWIRAFQF